MICIEHLDKVYQPEEGLILVICQCKRLNRASRRYSMRVVYFVRSKEWFRKTSFDYSVIKSNVPPAQVVREGNQNAAKSSATLSRIVSYGLKRWRLWLNTMVYLLWQTVWKCVAGRVDRADLIGFWSIQDQAYRIRGWDRVLSSIRIKRATEDLGSTR